MSAADTVVFARPFYQAVPEPLFRVFGYRVELSLLRIRHAGRKWHGRPPSVGKSFPAAWRHTPKPGQRSAVTKIARRREKAIEWRSRLRCYADQPSVLPLCEAGIREDPDGPFCILVNSDDLVAR